MVRPFGPKQELPRVNPPPEIPNQPGQPPEPLAAIPLSLGLGVTKHYCCVQSDDGGRTCADLNGDYEIWVGTGTRTFVYNVYDATYNYITKSQIVIVDMNTTELPAMIFSDSSPDDRSNSQRGIYGHVNGCNNAGVEMQLFKWECGSWNLNKKVITCTAPFGAPYSFGEMPVPSGTSVDQDCSATPWFFFPERNSNKHSAGTKSKPTAAVVYF
jgi:hypothetical protein